MKSLQFLGNRVEDAANAFIDVLKYSDQSVEYPDFKDIEPWPDEEHHVKLLKEVSGKEKSKGVTVIIK